MGPSARAEQEVYISLHTYNTSYNVRGDVAWVQYRSIFLESGSSIYYGPVDRLN